MVGEVRVGIPIPLSLFHPGMRFYPLIEPRAVIIRDSKQSRHFNLAAGYLPTRPPSDKVLIDIVVRLMVALDREYYFTSDYKYVIDCVGDYRWSYRGGVPRIMPQSDSYVCIREKPLLRYFSQRERREETTVSEDSTTIEGIVKRILKGTEWFKDYVNGYDFLTGRRR